MEWVVGEFVAVILVVTFGGITIWCFTSKSPVNFWSGDEVKPEEILDVKKWNKTLGTMWAIFTLPQLIAAILMPINSTAADVFLLADIVIGLPAMIIVYIAFEKKNRKKVKSK